MGIIEDLAMAKQDGAGQLYAVGERARYLLAGAGFDVVEGAWVREVWAGALYDALEGLSDVALRAILRRAREDEEARRALWAAHDLLGRSRKFYDFALSLVGLRGDAVGEGRNRGSPRHGA